MEFTGALDHGADGRAATGLENLAADNHSVLDVRTRAGKESGGDVQADQGWIQAESDCSTSSSM
ncbi:hypothetical protein [Streptomyces sp. PTD9-10]|uniref:hypothetical protein n=1 Tax=Streptomyces sp. PTD9-10 TaxID=3120151 RepID=UPI0030099D4D